MMPIEDRQILDPRLMYIDLIKRCVLNLPYVDVELSPIQPYGRLRNAVLSIFKTAHIQDLPECEKAVIDYRKKMGIDDEILAIDGAGIYWRKSG